LNPAVEIRLLVGREMRRSVRSAKGIILGVVTLLGAVATSFVLAGIEGAGRHTATGGALTTQEFIELQRQTIEQQTGNAALAAQAVSMPLTLKAFLDVTVLLTPFLIALLGFDAVSGELQHRSVRFWTVRSRRSSFFVGKLLGLWGLVALVTLVIQTIVGILARSKGYVTTPDLFSWGLRFWLVAVAIAGAWAALATLISSLFRTPVLALLTTSATFFVLWVLGTAADYSRLRTSIELGAIDTSTRWYEYVYPNAYKSLLLAQDGHDVLRGAALLLAFAACAAVGGAVLFERRDL
jgi:ABC-type transport system involved in multi-copper enzyme maturation permease subunit